MCQEVMSALPVSQAFSKTVGLFAVLSLYGSPVITVLQRCLLGDQAGYPIPKWIRTNGLDLVC